MVIESSLSVSVNRDLSLFYYIERHAVHIAAALSLMFLLSAVGSRTAIGALALGLLIAALIGMMLALLIGPEVNNARRWIQISSLSLQPSEFLKAGFIVINAWLLRFFWEDKRCFLLNIGLLGLIVLLLLAQKNFSMVMIFVSIWFVQYWMIEEDWRRFAALVSTFLLLFVGTALLFPHSNKRITSYVSGFFSAQTERSSLSWTQSERALTLFESGGVTGEASRDILSSFLPEQHTDFAFAVASRSFGVLFTLSVIGLLCLFAWAVYKDLRRRADPLVILAVSGGLFQIIVQSVLHMSSNLSLIPTVGLTFPFMSVGGSSSVASGLTLGFMLALLRLRD